MINPSIIPTLLARKEAIDEILNIVGEHTDYTGMMKALMEKRDEYWEVINHGTPDEKTMVKASVFSEVLRLRWQA